MPFTFKNSQKAVAAFLIIAVFLFITIIILIARGSDVLSLKTKYFTFFNEGYGMASGMVIKYKGITVGKIGKIELTTDDRIKIQINILGEYKRLIHKDSVLKAQAGLLGGANLILLPPVYENSELLPPGSMILSSDIPEGQDMMTALAAKSGAKDDITDKVKAVLDIVLDMKPMLMGTLANVRDSTGDLKDMMRGLKGENSTALSDKLLNILDNVRILTKNFKDLSTDIGSDKNTIGALIHDNKSLYTKINSMASSVDTSLNNVKNMTDKFKNTPDDIQALMVLLRENLIELRKVLSGMKNLLGGDKDSEKTIKKGDR